MTFSHFAMKLLKCKQAFDELTCVKNTSDSSDRPPPNSLKWITHVTEQTPIW